MHSNLGCRHCEQPPPPFHLNSVSLLAPKPNALSLETRRRRNLSQTTTPHWLTYSPPLVSMEGQRYPPRPTPRHTLTHPRNTPDIAQQFSTLRLNEPSHSQAGFSDRAAMPLNNPFPAPERRCQASGFPAESGETALTCSNGPLNWPRATPRKPVRLHSENAGFLSAPLQNCFTRLLVTTSLLSALEVTTKLRRSFQ